MKKFKNNIWNLIIVAISIMFFIPGVAYAAEARNSDIMLINESVEEEAIKEHKSSEAEEVEEIQKDLFIFEQSDYEMDKLVDGNAYIIATGNVKISGQINGNAYVLTSGKIEITEEAYIADSLYAIGTNEISISGIVYDAYVFTKDFKLQSTGGIARDAYILSNNASLVGQIYRNVNISSDDISLKDENDNELKAINGDFNYSSKNKIEDIENYVLQGNVNFKEMIEQEKVPTVKSMYSIIKEMIFGAITTVVYVLTICGVLKFVAPEFKKKLGALVQTNAAKALLVGLITMLIEIAAFIFSIILIFTSFLSPIAIIAWIIGFALIYISSAVLSISIYEALKGKMEKVKENNSLKIAMLSLIAIGVWVIQKLPIVGGIATLVIYLIGQGLIVKNFLPEKEN